MDRVPEMEHMITDCQIMLQSKGSKDYAISYRKCQSYDIVFT